MQDTKHPTGGRLHAWHRRLRNEQEAALPIAPSRALTQAEVLHQRWWRRAVTEGCWEGSPSKYEWVGWKWKRLPSPQQKWVQGQGRIAVFISLKPSWSPPWALVPSSAGCPHKPISNQSCSPNTHSGLLCAVPSPKPQTLPGDSCSVNLKSGGGCPWSRAISSAAPPLSCQEKPSRQ